MLLACAIAVLAAVLAVRHLYPVPCDKCGRRVLRSRGVRLAPGWRFFVKESPLRAERPFLCGKCFEDLLRDSPAKDKASREALAAYLTDAHASAAVREAFRRGPKDASRAPVPPASGSAGESE